MSIAIQAAGLVSGTAPADRVREPLAVRRTEEAAGVRTPAPMRDEYVPEEKREASGLYWPGRDENGEPKIYFDDPEKAGKDSEPETCTGSTDQVDREIENLRKKREELEHQLSAETDEAKAKDLERQLAQVERELRQKDNDAYRRQHAVFS